jgi:hypothetical protein
VNLIIAFPVRYIDEGQIIVDADNNHIADVRGWGRLKNIQSQDDIGTFIADAINAYVE